MLQKLEITGIHFEVQSQVRNYATTKLGYLDRYLPKHSRESAHMEVRLINAQVRRGKKEMQCEITLRVPRETIVLSEQAPTIYAAIDLAEMKMKQQIKKYKEELGVGEERQRLFSRIGRKFFRGMLELSE